LKLLIGKKKNVWDKVYQQKISVKQDEKTIKLLLFLFVEGCFEHLSDEELQQYFKKFKLDEIGASLKFFDIYELYTPKFSRLGELGVSLLFYLISHVEYSEFSEVYPDYLKQFKITFPEMIEEEVIKYSQLDDNMIFWFFFNRLIPLLDNDAQLKLLRNINLTEKMRNSDIDKNIYIEDFLRLFKDYFKKSDRKIEGPTTSKFVESFIEEFIIKDSCDYLEDELSKTFALIIEENKIVEVLQKYKVIERLNARYDSKSWDQKRINRFFSELHRNISSKTILKIDEIFPDKITRRKLMRGLPEKEFKVSDLITLEFENTPENRSIIVLLNGERFFFHRSLYSIKLYLKTTDSKEDRFINYGDHAGEYSPEYRAFLKKVSFEQEFWVYCSNIQAWVENNYDTKLLDYCCAFPILRKLVELGDTKAQKAYKKEILKGLTSQNEELIRFLLEKEYFNYLDLEERKRVLLTIFEKNTFRFIFLYVLNLTRKYPSKPFDLNMPTHLKKVLASIPKEDILISLFKNSEFDLVTDLDYWINQDKIDDVINKASEKREIYVQKFLERHCKESLTAEEEERTEYFLFELRHSESYSERDARRSKQRYVNYFGETNSWIYLKNLFESISKKNVLNLLLTQTKKEIFEFDYDFYGFSLHPANRSHEVGKIQRSLSRLFYLYSFLISYLDKEKLEQFLFEKNSIAIKKLISLSNRIHRYDKRYIMAIIIRFFKSIDNRHFEQFYPKPLTEEEKEEAEYLIKKFQK